MMLLDTSLKSR